MKSNDRARQLSTPCDDRNVDAAAHAIIASMTPCEIGRLLYPTASPVPVADVPVDILNEHLSRYTQAEIDEGQFLLVAPGKFTFIMGHQAKAKRDVLAHVRETEQFVHGKPKQR